jgi:predicted MFS family arabinose efflux permease
MWMLSSPFGRFVAFRAIDEFGSQILSLALAWQVYAVTHDPMSLAYAGLVRFLPNVVLALIAGQAADRYDRRSIVALSMAVQTLCFAALCALLLRSTLSAAAAYILLGVFGAAQAFLFPAMSAIQPHVTTATESRKAIALCSSVLQVCTLAAPALGGVLFTLSAPGLFAGLSIVYLVALTQIRRLPSPPGSRTPAISALDGLRYVCSNRLLFSLISLDLFAVLLGGATALLPIYARDILAVGPAGLGCLRCAPGAGAALAGITFGRRGMRRRTGTLMLGSVAGFGVATLVFALSTDFRLSLLALAAAGAFDMISVVIRQTAVQYSTPDSMRGRVSAVQGVFIGASSEIGEFESGATAALFGTVPAAVLGGLGTLAVVALWSALFPELRNMDEPCATSGELRYATSSDHHGKQASANQAA